MKGTGRVKGMLATAVAMARAGGLAVVFFAVLGGTALVTAAGVVVDSAFRSQPPVRLSGADVVVSAPQSISRKEDFAIALPERATVPGPLVREVAAVPGVAGAVGDLSFPAAVLPQAAHGPAPAKGPAADPAAAGHGWSSALLSGRLAEGREPRAAGEVALGPGLPGHVGRRVRIMAAGRPAGYLVTGRVTAPGIYVADPVAAGLAGRTAGAKAGRADLVAVRAAPGVRAEDLAERIRARIGGRYEVATGRDRAVAESPAIGAARETLLMLPGSIGGISLLIVGFVVGGGMSLSVDRQRPDLALLRAAGATPRQVRRLVGLQALAAAVPALIPGAALGYFLAARLGDLLVTVGALRPDHPLAYGPLPALAAAPLLLGVVRVASWAASLRVSRMPVAAGIADAREPSRLRTNTGLLIMLGALVLSAVPLFVRGEIAAVGPATAALLAVIGLALAGPRLVRRAAGALASSPLMARLPRTAWLAVHNTHGHAPRTAGAVAALGMAVTLGLSVVLTHTTLGRARTDEAALGLRGLVTLTAPALGGVPHGLVSDVRDLTPATAVATTTVVTEPLLPGDDPELMSRPAMALGPDAEGLVDLDVVAGGLAGLRGNTVALDEDAGRVGDRVRLVMGDGARVEAVVVATYRRSLGFGPIVVSRDLAAAHTTTGLDGAVLARKADLGPVLARWPGVELSTAPEGPQAGAASAQLLLNVAVLAVLLGYVLVAVANRLVATTTGRREELAGLRRVGASSRQLRRMVRWEAALIGAAACGAGLLLSAVPLALLSAGFLGRPVPAGPLWLLPASMLVVALVVWAAMELPARKMLR
ncbi:FtsX-like permease family protein [Bailinhaonella thermotolerans]|uniref:ABC transporter permease n=1 Tax=Bailinhaonella thermotolerans TaxID=1070861 RepID=A0A3A4BFZ6_9ACTN|nr:ABC transporter permease [Bailinhaonella thermotolerans]RJL33412.1 ABC transporter permease [Bailinhaonella thermotolerans]